MKFPDFKRYVFAYVTIFMSCCHLYFAWRYINTGVPEREMTFCFHPRCFYAYFIAISILGSIISIVLLVLEILIRKFIIIKYFPNFKFSLPITVPLIISRIYSLIFNFVFIITTIPMVFIDLYIVINYIHYVLV